VERLGPLWRGGFVWVAHATICRPGGAPVQTAEIDGVFSTIQIRVYDPVGNLRPPPAQ
jgi:hypothetical protein